MFCYTICMIKKVDMLHAARFTWGRLTFATGVSFS